MSAPSNGITSKNQQAERALPRATQLVAILQMVEMQTTSGDTPGVPDDQEYLLTEDERVEVTRLGLGLARELRTLLEQLLPDPRAWGNAEMPQWMEAQASTQTSEG